MLIRKKTEKHLFGLQTATFCVLILEVAFILYPQHQGISIGLLVLTVFLGLGSFVFGWSSGNEDIRLSIMTDIICVLLLLGLSFETDLLGEYKWMLTPTAMLFFLLDIGRGNLLKN